MAWAPPTDDILDLKGVRRRSDSFRFELCDRDMTPIGTLHPDRDQSVPTIENDTNNETARRLTGLKLMPSEAADVNTLTDRLRVYMTPGAPGGIRGSEYRLGTFLWGGEDQPQRSWGLEHHSELVDRTYILSKKSTQAFGWSRGANITLMMFFLFGRAAFRLEDIAVIGESANRGLRDPRAWEPGSTWLEKLNDLGAGTGFVSPWADEHGRIYFDAIPDPAVSSPTVPEYGPDTRMVADSIVYSGGLLDAPNDFGASDSGTDRIRTGRYQLPASAPHSFANRGWRIGETRSVQGSSDSTALNANARALARGSDVLDYVTFSSTLDPRHGTYAIVPCPDRDGIMRNWLEDSWAMELRSGGLMQHTLRRISYDVI
jgi:hypothetical protein